MSCRVSTCLLLWQGKEVGYSWNNPTCAWPSIWAKWPKKGFYAQQSRKRNIRLWNLASRSETSWRGVLSTLGIEWWRQWYKHTQLWFVKTTRPDAFLARMAPQRICRHTGNPKAQEHLHPIDADSQLRSWRHLCPACHPPQSVTILEHKVPKSSTCWRDTRIYIHIFAVLNVFILMHLPRIASRIQILIQICWLMKEHPMVSTLSVVW